MIFPAELVTLLGSTALAGGLKMIALKMEMSRLEKMHMLSIMDKQGELIKGAREYSNTGFQWTRRFIAVVVTLSVIAFPMYAAVWHPGIAINIGYTEIQTSFLDLFGSKEAITWKTLEGGLTITPMHTHLMASIAGLYFGSSIMKG